MRAKIATDAEGRFWGIRITCPGCACFNPDMGHLAGYLVLPVDWTPPGYERAPMHSQRPRWNFNGDLEKPTFTPSIKTTHGSNEVCHSFVRDGRIQFLADCTHALAGQTVDLPEIQEDDDAQ